MIKTERLEIREIDNETAYLIEHNSENNEDKTYDFSSFMHEIVQDNGFGVDEILEIIQVLAKVIKRDSNNSMIFGAYDSENNLIACARFYNSQSNTPEISITVDKPYRQNGYATEFLTSLLQYMFKIRNDEYYIYRIIKCNKASEKLINKLGGVLQKPETKAEGLIFGDYYLFRQ